jgi:hypothetical protein
MLLTVAQSVYSLTVQSQRNYFEEGMMEYKIYAVIKKKAIQKIMYSQHILLALTQHSLEPQTQFSWLPMSNLFKSLRTVQQ